MITWKATVFEVRYDHMESHNAEEIDEVTPAVRTQASYLGCICRDKCSSHRVYTGRLCPSGRL